MPCCCNENDPALQQLQAKQSRILKAVLAINALMFVVEFGAGWLASSTALLADSLDMLGDALVYGLSLYVVARGDRWKAVSAGAKGTIMIVFGLLVAAEAVSKIIIGEVPTSSIMALVGFLALAGNGVCLYLLTRHRSDDVNMRSSWICSRNDLVANSGVIVAAMLVAISHTVWPDVVVGSAIAGLFIHSAIGVLRDARTEYRRASPAHPA